jgi:hypothetical protein
MAVTKTILKKSKNEVVVKFANTGGTNQTATFDLDVDALLSTEVIEGTVKINIVAITFTGVNGSSFSLSRDGLGIFAAPCDQPDQFYFDGWVDGINNTHDIVCTMTEESYVYLTLRKSSGFETKLELSRFGSYDDPNARGS